MGIAGLYDDLHELIRSVVTVFPTTDKTVAGHEFADEITVCVDDALLAVVTGRQIADHSVRHALSLSLEWKTFERVFVIPCGGDFR